MNSPTLEGIIGKVEAVRFGPPIRFVNPETRRLQLFLANLRRSYELIESEQAFTTAAAVSFGRGKSRLLSDYTLDPGFQHEVGRTDTGSYGWLGRVHLADYGSVADFGIQDLWARNAPSSDCEYFQSVENQWPNTADFVLTAPLFYVPFHRVSVRYELDNLPHCVAVVVYGLKLVYAIVEGRALRHGERKRRHRSTVSAAVRAVTSRIRNIRPTAPIVQQRRDPSSGSAEDDASSISLVSLRKRGMGIGHATDRRMRDVSLSADDRIGICALAGAVPSRCHVAARRSVWPLSGSETYCRAA